MYDGNRGEFFMLVQRTMPMPMYAQGKKEKKKHTQNAFLLQRCVRVYMSYTHTYNVPWLFGSVLLTPACIFVCRSYFFKQNIDGGFIS